MTNPTPQPSPALCPQCGAHLANWRQVFGSEHKCYPPVPRPDDMPDETKEEAMADARADIYFHDHVEHKGMML